MSDCNSLKFDKMVVDTSLAQEYFKKKKNVFMPIINGQPVQNIEHICVVDPYQNKVYCTAEKCKDFVKPTIVECNWTTPGDALWKLAKKIKENGELFCQLQHALTEHPIEDIRNCDLPLLINRCLHISTLMDKYSEQVLNMHKIMLLSVDEAPLYLLSGAVSYISAGVHVVIIAPARIAAVCTLFLDLCAEVGLHHYVSLNFRESEDSQSDVAEDGCVGIVTETADLDSAVQSFVSSTTLYPWKLKALLIQESVYEEFQRALQWKCNLNAEVDDRLEPRMRQLSADVQVSGEKIFLLDYVGGDVQHPTLHPVLVSAFRTTKELLTIMSKYKKDSFVSLWSSDSAQAHEIAFALSTPCVWINNYAVFNGSQVSSALPVHSLEGINDEELTKMATAWLKLDLEKRRDVMFETLHKYLESVTGDEKKVAAKVQTSLKAQKLGFIDVNKSHIWLGIESAVGLVYIGNTANAEYFADAVASTVYGNSVLLNTAFNKYSLIEVLRKAGVPIRVSDDTKHATFELYKTRVIYTNFGTIFAN